VGVTAFAQTPAGAQRKPRVSGFSSVDYQKIEALRPDLVITFSDVQAEASRELIRRGYPVVATNQRSLEEIFATVQMLGRIVGREAAARRLAARMTSALAPTAGARQRPAVYFEEWNNPLISGVGWVGEMIERAGGRDIFPELRNRGRAPDRVVSGEEVVRRQPDIIIASWCGKKARLDQIRNRPGWDSIPAVSADRIYEIDSQRILQPGPSLAAGMRELRRIIGAFGPTRVPRKSLGRYIAER
jgi:iron complex transport system substrate-binding protein